MEAASSLDPLGALLSSACAFHCLIVPLLPLASLGFVAGEATELGLFVLAVAVAVPAALLGWRRHRHTALLLAFLGAIVIIVAGRVLGEDLLAARVMIIGGALALAVSHLVNRRLMRCPRSCEACADPARELRPG